MFGSNLATAILPKTDVRKKKKKLVYTEKTRVGVEAKPLRSGRVQQLELYYIILHYIK